MGDRTTETNEGNDGRTNARERVKGNDTTTERGNHVAVFWDWVGMRFRENEGGARARAREAGEKPRGDARSLRERERKGCKTDR